ncbi:MAG TPA: DUF4097 family beta strand repeat-containing protein [Terriglobia bacterium]|nr:DUF4097 family beta strand repeat-containing protein [Terriglobia bacterium]
MSIYSSYRRGSIFWALTLIGVGFIFLYQNFNPAIRPWTLLAKYWPILIIFWGISKLIDYIQASRIPDAPPISLFSGSEVVLLLLILIFGSLVSKIVLHPWQHWSWVGINSNGEDWANPFLDSYNYTQTFSQSVPANPHLVITNRRGDVEIRAGNQSGIDAVVKETIRASSEDQARKLHDQLKVSMAEQSGHYILQTNLDSMPNGGSAVRLDLTLHVPAATTTQIAAERGGIIVDGLTGDQTLTSDHGDVQVSNVKGFVRVHKSHGSTEVRDVNGNVQIEGRGGDVDVANVQGMLTVNGEFSGSVQLQNVSQTTHFVSSRTDLTAQRLTGRLDMEMGSLEINQIDGPAEITTHQKDVTVQGFKHSIKISNNNGDVELRPAAPLAHSIEVESKQGEIELDLPPNSGFQIDAVSQHGDVETDFTGPSLKVEKQGDAPSISGTYGKGGPTIHLSTTYGTIRLSKGEGSPTQPSRQAKEFQPRFLHRAVPARFVGQPAPPHPPAPPLTPAPEAPSN